MLEDRLPWLASSCREQRLNTKLQLFLIKVGVTLFTN